jgi:hypothetical protein
MCSNGSGTIFTPLSGSRRTRLYMKPLSQKKRRPFPSAWYTSWRLANAETARPSPRLCPNPPSVPCRDAVFEIDRLQPLKWFCPSAVLLAWAVSLLTESGSCSC